MHTPVFADTVNALVQGHARAVDGTVGDGGHAAGLRSAGATVLAIDRDPEAIARARQALGDDGITWIVGQFGAAEVLARIDAFRPDFMLLDLGVSSHQLDADVRGFSFRPDVPLDMRMEPGGTTAADVLNTLSAIELARVFREFGDERRARRLASTVVRRRARRPFRRSDDLVNAIRAVLGPQAGPSDFARIFQAVRIGVNRELEQLQTALPSMQRALVLGGLLAVISYHSGEDRIVKRLFKEWSRECICPPGQPVCTCRGRRLGWMEPRRPLTPSEAEVAANPRARSARLRVFRVADDA